MTSSENPGRGDGGPDQRKAEVEADVTRLFQQYFEAGVEPHQGGAEPGQGGAEPRQGYEVESGFGDRGAVTGSTATGKFTFVRWRWRGRHTGTVGRFDGEARDDALFSMARG
ncbi:MAG TPA: hypothetical protein VFI47_08055, partial [Acidimicrobiales bacterium]|nr:hypothetical protein [Acidimicrobiales bacterium]